MTLAMGLTASGQAVPLRVDSNGQLIVSGSVGGSSGGSSDTTEATQLLVKAAVQSIDGKVATAANQATVNLAFGAPADARATWYDTAANIIQVLKLAVAAFVGAGSRTYTYTSGQLTSEAWTLFGTTRTKTYTYTSGALTGESDWV